jgi:hypothetical protein
LSKRKESLTLYCSGAMTGVDNLGFPAFDEAADILRKMGHVPISPAQHDRDCGWVKEEDGKVIALGTFDLHAAMSWDLTQVAQADGIVLLPGWETSVGAGHERYVAEACGKRIFFLIDGKLVEEKNDG